MHRVFVCGLAAALVPVCTALSQATTVFPSDHTGSGPNPTIPGASYTYYNPYSNGVARQMIFYDRWDVRISTGRHISRIGFPRDEALSSPGYGVALKVQMGQSVNRLASVSTTFAQNFTTTPVNVFASAAGSWKVLALPNLGTGGVDIAWLPFDAPFTFDATKSLVVDFQVYSNQNNNNAFNYYLDVATARSIQRSFGQACQTGGGLTPSLTSSPTNSAIGGNWYIDLQNAPSTTPTALFVGLLPHEPGISLDVIGMTGCSLYLDPLWVGGYVTNPGGWYNWSFPIPNLQTLFGGKLYSQVAMNDIWANSFGWISSNGDELQLGIPPQATLIYGNQGDAQATTGWFVEHFGLVTIFDHD